MQLPASWDEDEQVEVGHLFVYGTLRPGCSLHRVIERAVVGQPLDVFTWGGLYHTRNGSIDRPIYPVADFDRPGIVHGTLLYVDPEAPQLASTVSMELGAGYRGRTVPVWPEGADHRSVRSESALAFQFNWQPGPRIPSGDWIEEAGVRA
jgi:gamma-glutamylcyclotransferase (GGCT)/AIG2-like uncharacterized protein YtfP